MADIVNAVIVKGAVDELRASIVEFNTQTARQNKRMLQLTFVITILTLVMLIAVGAQIYLAITATESLPHQHATPNPSSQTDPTRR